MSRKDSKSISGKILSAVGLLVHLGFSLLLLLLQRPSATTTLAWTSNAMRSGASSRQTGNPNAPTQRAMRLVTMAPNRPTSSGLFLSAPQQTVESTSHGNENAPNNPQVLDATLVGDYLIQMVVSSSNEGFSWQLHSIKDVVRVSLSGNDETRWTDGTEATEALSYGLTSFLSELTPRAEILCGSCADGDVLDSTVIHHSNPNDEKDLLSLLQILQAQWVFSLQNTEHESKSTSTQESPWRISRESLKSQEGLSVLFQEAGLLDGDGSKVEWVEMMTGSSQIVGRLPRNLVHKFNILHRGIGAFVTKDRPIDRSSLLDSSTLPMPDLYVHRRVAHKRIFPNLYDMFVGGVSLAGEDAELTAQREIAEELGLSNSLSTSLVALTGGSPFLKCLICTAYNRCLVDLFQYVVDTKTECISWQEEEVAWGDFVNYNVIQASADLSMQRAASEGTWPGPYPPIQSELKGVLPKGEGNDGGGLEIARYDGKWNEWDYVPDGLLVWKAWLEMIEMERKSQQQDSVKATLSFEVEFGVGEGKSEIAVVELSSMKDIVPQSQQLAARFNTNINDMQSMLKQMWADATDIPVYDGPSLSIENDHTSEECSIELPSGLVLELRPSTIGEDAGLGLFVRKASSDVGDVLQTQGSTFCGYGPCEKIADSIEGVSNYQRQRSFQFLLSDGLESYVWHKGNLLTVGDVIKATGATSVRSHLLVETSEDEGGDGSMSLILDPKGKPCYLIPPEERPDPKSLTIQTIGHMCNDLAGGISGQAAEEYASSSDVNNLLVLVPRVAVNDDGVLEPTGMPILTLAKSVYIGNVAESMEVGLRYGDSYWKNTVS